MQLVPFLQLVTLRLKLKAAYTSQCYLIKVSCNIFSFVKLLSMDSSSMIFLRKFHYFMYSLLTTVLVLFSVLQRNFAAHLRGTFVRLN